MKLIFSHDQGVFGVASKQFDLGCDGCYFDAACVVAACAAPRSVNPLPEGDATAPTEGSQNAQGWRAHAVAGKTHLDQIRLPETSQHHKYASLPRPLHALISWASTPSLDLSWTGVPLVSFFTCVNNGPGVHTSLSKISTCR